MGSLIRLSAKRASLFILFESLFESETLLTNLFFPKTPYEIFTLAHGTFEFRGTPTAI